MSQRSGPGSAFTFSGALASVMIALKLKERWDDYKQVATEDEGRVALGSPSVHRDPREFESGDVEAMGLLNTEIPIVRPKRKRASCCVCCGMDCSLFWKAFGIVVALFAVWNAFKLIRWAVSPTPSGLEHMPVFSTSLPCLDAPYIYAGQPTSFSVPIGAQNDHGMDVRGGTVGTITVLEGSPMATKVMYEITLRTDDKSLLDEVLLDHPADQDGVKDSHLLIATGHPREGACIRYDVRMFVPPTLKNLHIKSHASITHVQFDPDSHIQLNEFFITLFSVSNHNLIIPHNNLRSHKMALELTEGWIVGDVSIGDSTKLTTQRGSGVMNVKVHPTPPQDPAAPEVASLRTTSGSGRTDVFYVDHDAHVHRPISNIHISSKNADVYLTYRDAHYSGLVNLGARSYTATGLQRLSGEAAEGSEWTHWFGDEQGADRVEVKSRGWVGVYF